jgi:hypothetical protein
MAQNILKKDLEFFLKILGIKEPITEFRFHPTRRWRFDYAWPSLKIALEWEGVMCKKSRHTTVVGYTSDCTKYNEATVLGWQVYRITTLQKKRDVFILLERIFRNA